MKDFDFIIIGAGIVGASAAWQLIQACPQASIAIIEKESAAATHQTGRNSGVIHAGVYYQPGSLKATYCREGLQETIRFCEQYNLPYLQCGKLIVATDPTEVERMHALYERSRENQLTTRLVDEHELRTLEPHVAGLGAIAVKETGITDYTKITQTMLNLFKDQGGRVIFDERVEEVEENDAHVAVQTGRAKYSTRFLINCAGLYSDTLIRKMGIPCDFRIIPFRGEYFKLPESYNNIVKHLIYPVPDPEMPFLGVHLTRMIDGSVTVGPNAVLAGAREGYSKTEINLSELTETLGYKGFWKLLAQHGKSGITELKNSFSKKGYLSLVQKYCPRIQLDDLQPYPSGVRAQAVSDTGELVHDFRFLSSTRSLHVGNAPSPAATSAIPIGREIVKRVLQRQ